MPPKLWLNNTRPSDRSIPAPAAGFDGLQEFRGVPDELLKRAGLRSIVPIWGGFSEEDGRMTGEGRMITN